MFGILILIGIIFALIPVTAVRQAGLNPQPILRQYKIGLHYLAYAKYFVLLNQWRRRPCHCRNFAGGHGKSTGACERQQLLRLFHIPTLRHLDWTRRSANKQSCLGYSAFEGSYKKRRPTPSSPIKWHSITGACVQKSSRRGAALAVEKCLFKDSRKKLSAARRCRHTALLTQWSCLSFNLSEPSGHFSAPSWTAKWLPVPISDWWDQV